MGSQEHFRILGLNPQATKPSLEVFWERVHPDDRISLQLTLNPLFKKRKISNRNFGSSLQIILLDHLHGAGHAILNEANELVEFIGSTIDITERKAR